METITAKCSCCGYEESYELSDEESVTFHKYKIFGRHMGMIQDLFPNIPSWIRSGAIDKNCSGFCICPKCSPK